jgi:hypothetical protein
MITELALLRLLPDAAPAFEPAFPAADAVSRALYGNRKRPLALRNVAAIEEG